MNVHMSLLERHHERTVDEIIAEAIKREKQLQKFYEDAAEDVGPDASPTIAYLCDQHTLRIRRLEEMSAEITALRELTASIAD